MRCPYCDGEMRIGYVQSPRHSIFWAEEKHSFLVMPTKKDVRLSEGIFSVPAVESYCCKDCRKIIIGF